MMASDRVSAGAALDGGFRPLEGESSVAAARRGDKGGDKGLGGEVIMEIQPRLLTATSSTATRRWRELFRLRTPHAAMRDPIGSAPAGQYR